MAAGHSLEVDASPETVWRIWSDTDHWKDWNPTVRSIQLDKPFGDGAQGTMSTSAGRTHQVSIGSVRPGRSFVLDAKPIPLTTFHFTCAVEPSGSGSRVTQSISFSGLGAILSPMMGKQVSADFPKILEALKQRAEGQQKSPAPSPGSSAPTGG